MQKIIDFQHERKIVPLTIPALTNYYENTFTVIVGKNGVGKSRLLSSMVNKFIRTDKLPFGFEHFDDDLEFDYRVIAVSTSPFDKFKLSTKYASKDYSVRTNYKYVGMRSGGPYGASAISLISSATKGILDKFLEDESYDRLRDVFNTLGFLPEVQLIFKPNFSRRRYVTSEKEVAYEKYYKGVEWLDETDVSFNSKAMDGLGETSDYEKHKISNALQTVRDIFNYEKAVSIDLDFNHGKVFSINRESYKNVQFLESINTLVSYNLIRLMDMRLHKVGYGDMSLRRASSGEQCMLVIMLGIAGNISDNSLIFIDEPEISLHPKWQEEFMSLLVKTFDKYKACQFFIATHSPQIVSNLKNKNCFVTSLTKNEIYPSYSFYDRSSDFQLAELFDAPGYRNEYIARIAFSLLSKIKNTKSIQQKDANELNKLLKLSESMDRKDPTYELIESIKEVVKYYASNQ